MNVGIVGGGASGIMAAIIAAEHGASVTIFEKKDRLGKKILVTGNGRCNYTNLNLGSNYYYTDDAIFVENRLNEFGNVELIRFFKQLGVLSKDRNGYVYPSSDQALTILEALEYAIKESKVKVNLNTDVSSVIKEGNCFKVTSSDNKVFYFDKVIISAGGKSSLLKNESCNSFNLLRNFGHSLVTICPALSPLKCLGLDFKKISGVKSDCRISVSVNDKVMMEDEGEVLFTDNGISGIVTFQVSHCAIEASRNGNNVIAKLDLFPGMTVDDLKSFISLKFLTHSELTCEEFLTGFLNKKINSLLLERCSIDPKAIVNDIGVDSITKCIIMAKDLSFDVKSDASFDKSQVTGGGIPLSEISENFESKLVTGLFATGEVLNVDGICGGYNLQWAFTSGYIAGKHAAV